MPKDDEQEAALFRSLVESPKRDNGSYHLAMSKARELFEQAEAALGGPVEFKIKTKLKPNGKMVVKWTFSHRP
ncbi:hypothetical protein [Oryzifoliimicrobium ureilyticus]|uniref:hypothetical protein n=1 Tax=Oryzifoliimicrobium ureilyticus TaxID=3113724 RepID=UPI003076609B